MVRDRLRQEGYRFQRRFFGLRRVRGQWQRRFVDRFVCEGVERLEAGVGSQVVFFGIEDVIGFQGIGLQVVGVQIIF